MSLQFNIDHISNIEKLVLEKKIVSYIDAIIHYCDIYGYEIEVIASVVKKSPTIKSKLQYEAEELNFMKKSARLPL
jgi:hypothetical protein